MRRLTILAVSLAILVSLILVGCGGGGSY